MSRIPTPDPEDPLFGRGDEATITNITAEESPDLASPTMVYKGNVSVPMLNAFKEGDRDGLP